MTRLWHKSGRGEQCQAMTIAGKNYPGTSVFMSPTKAAEQLPLMLDIEDLQKLMKCGRTTAYARTRDASFPEPVVFSGSSYRWWKYEVLEWVESHRGVKRPTRSALRRPADQVDEPLPVPRPVARTKRGEAA